MTISSAQQVEPGIANAEVRQSLVDAYCEIRGVASIWKSTLGVLLSFSRQHGEGQVIEWMLIAQRTLGSGASEKRFGKFVSGCRRRWLAEQGTSAIGSEAA